MPTPTKDTTPVAPLPAGETEDAYGAMSSAFDELLAVEPTPVDDKVTDAAGEVVPPAGDTKPPEGETTPSAAVVPPAVETPPVVPAVATPPVETPPVDDWEKRYKDLEAKVAKVPAVETPPPAETPPADTKARETYSTTEKEFLESYEKEYGDSVGRGEALKRRAEYAELTTHIFGEIQRVFGPLVERGVAAADVVSETTALAIYHKTHPDFDDAMFDSINEWAEGLSGYRKKYAQGVIEGGEPEDVVDLITEYKSAKGLSKPKVVAGTAVAPVPPVATELSPAAKKAAKALGVVDSKRSAASPNVVDPNDFDGAWNEALGS